MYKQAVAITAAAGKYKMLHYVVVSSMMSLYAPMQQVDRYATPQGNGNVQAEAAYVMLHQTRCLYMSHTAYITDLEVAGAVQSTLQCL